MRIVAGVEEQAFHRSARLAPAEEPRLEDGDIVAEEPRSGGQQFGQVAEQRVFGSGLPPADDHEARFVALVGGRLGDPFGREFVIE